MNEMPGKPGLEVDMNRIAKNTVAALAFLMAAGTAWAVLCLLIAKLLQDRGVIEETD